MLDSIIRQERLEQERLSKRYPESYPCEHSLSSSVLLKVKYDLPALNVMKELHVQCGTLTYMDQYGELNPLDSYNDPKWIEQLKTDASLLEAHDISGNKVKAKELWFQTYGLQALISLAQENAGLKERVKTLEDKDAPDSY